MGICWAEVEYEVTGRRYRTVHGFQSDSSLLVDTFNQDDYINWGADLIGDADFEGATDPTNAGIDPRTLIEATLYFHRHMQSTQVTLRTLSLHDGATPGTATGNFVSLNLDLQCRGNPFLGSGDLAGLNNTMLITKQPYGFSQRKGRMFLRGAIRNTHILAGDEDGVTFIPGARASYALELYTGAIGAGVGNSTRLFSYMWPGKLGQEGANCQYVIPTTTAYTGPDPETGQIITKRVLSGFTSVQTLAVTDAQSRDTRRRTRKK